MVDLSWSFDLVLSVCSVQLLTILSISASGLGGGDRGIIIAVRRG